MHLLHEIRRLREADLQSDLRLVVGMILQDSATTSNGAFENSLLGRLQKYEVMVYYADALVANSEYKRAEKIYKQALHMRLEIAFHAKVAKSKPIITTTAAPASAAPTAPAAAASGRAATGSRCRRRAGHVL